jgi:hypothetical protein
MQSTPSNPSGSNYRETFAYLCSMLPKSPDDTPDVRAVRNMGAMDAVAALNPCDAFGGPPRRADRRHGRARR